jgi:long-subunit acyl-CoA synthetase (AMP-forming)
MAAPTHNDLAKVSHEALSQPTFCAAFQLTASVWAERPALTTPDGSLTLTWSDYAERVRRVAEGLASLGVRRGDCVGVLLSNRPEFHIVDSGAVHLGATPFSIYHTNPAEQIVPLLVNSNARVVVTESAFLERILAAQAQHPALAHIIVVDAEGDGLISLAELESRTVPGFDFDATWRALRPEEVVTLVYTSGTTGEPKGVQHTHATIMASCLSMHQYAPFTPQGRVVSYLPNAHIAERFISHYCSQVFGLTITACADPRELAAAIVRTRPTRLFGVPRIYEKLMAGVMGMAAGEPDGSLASAIDAGLDRVRAQQAGETVGARSPHDAEILANVRARLGLDAAEWVGVAAAPSPYPMLAFFRAIGVDLVEFWGMSECIFSVAPPREKVKLGRIGIAAPGVEIRLAEDGEILVRGPNLMVGYRGEPEKTAEAIDAEGWLHSGDLAESDAYGYLKIVDRKKELIINSAGKNMAPTKIEMAITQESALIAQVVAIGDRRAHVTALIVLDEEACAKDPSYDVAGGLAAFADSPVAHERIAAAVAAGNEHLARVEQVRRYTILKEAWAPGSDVLTPTQKLRRRAISERYASVIDAMYSSDQAS